MIKHVMGSAASVVTNVDHSMVQPNAVDLRIGKVFQAVPVSRFSLTDEVKGHLQKKEILPDDSGWFHLLPGYYEVEFQHKVAIGESEAGIVVGRSTLMRNGVTFYSCLYDSGYHGKMVAGMEVRYSFDFPVGTRVAQFLAVEAESLKLYNGSYQGS